MGGKSSTTTQQVSIPPEVLARYNAVNARAEQAAGTPFQPYSYNPADFVAQMTPTQLAGIQNINYAAGQAQPYYDEATGQLMGAQMAATPYYGAAADIYGQAYGQAQPINQYSLAQLGRAGQIGEALSQQALGTLDYANYAAQPLQQQAAMMYGGAYGQAQPLNQMALQQFYSGLGAAQPLSEQALANLAYGQAQGQQLTGGALSGLGAAQQAAYPYQQLATQYAGAGAAPISPGALQTGVYMSPYMQNVISPTMALLNQQNQQAMAGQTANAIRSGAFGGDRAAIAAANLAQQQQLASGKVLGDLLQSGYGQALATAQQQQQLGLSAEQANRAAQAAAAGQMLGIGQQGFGQALEAARQQQAAAQALYGQGATTAQQQAALAQQLYGQQTGVGQNVQGLAQQLYQQGLGTGQAQQSLAQQLFGQGATTAQQQAAIAQQLFGQGATQAQQQAAMAQQMYQQGMGLGQAQQGIGKELYGMGAATAQQLAALGQGAQGAALQGAQAQMGAGQAQQQTAQAGLQALYNQYLQQQGYPFQVAQFLANVAMGTGALSGSTTTTNQPGGLFSDERVKENIRRIGKTEDGQPIYAYNYKGDPKEHTQIGLIAQEVEKKHPEAVGLAGGIKTVNYDKATRKSAGLARHDDVIEGEYTAKEGGHVHPEHAGLGFADGGMPYSDPNPTKLDIPDEKPDIQKLELPGKPPGPGRSTMDDIKDIAQIAAMFLSTGGRAGYADGGSPGLVSPADMAALLQAQAQMFGPYSQANRPIGGAPGGAGFVPAGNLPVSGLAVAKGDLPRQMSTIEQAKQLGDVGKTGVELYKKGKEAGVFGKDEDPLQKELKDYGVFARGGLAGRKGYADGLSVYGEENPDLVSFDTRDSGGGETLFDRLTRFTPREGTEPTASRLTRLTSDRPAQPAAPAPAALNAQSTGRTGATGSWEDQGILDRLGNYIFENSPISPLGVIRGASWMPSGETSAKPAAPPPVSAAGPDKSQPRRPGLAPKPAAPVSQDQVQQFAADVGGEQPVAAPSAPASPTAERDLGMAPSLEGSTVPGTPMVAGLGAATKPAVAKTPSEPGKLNKFLEWAKKPENFIPLATGITGTIMAPTRNPLVAAAYGLQSGVQAYQPTLQKQAQLEQTKATTGQTQALTLNQLYQMAGSRNLVPIEDPNGPFSVGGKRYSLAPISAAIKRPEGAAGATAPSGPTVLGNAGTQAASTAGNRFLMASPEEQKSSKEQIDALAGDAVQAQSDMMDINRFASAASFPRSGAYESGAFFPIKSQVANYYNSLISTFIRDPDMRAKLQIDPQGMTESAIAEKVTTGTAALREAGAGQRSFGALQAFLKATPNQTMPREAMLNLIADMVVHNQQTMDKAQYVRDFDRRVEAQTGLPRSFYATDALDAYGKDNPVTKYQSDRDRLYSVMEKNQYQNIVKLLQNPDTRDQMMSALDSKYGAGFHRYFTGARY